MDLLMYFNNIQINITFGVDDDDFECEFSVTELNNILKNNEFDKIILNEFETFLNECKLSEEEEQNIILTFVGGTTRIPYIRNLIIEYMKNNKNNNNEVNKTMNNDESICLGNSYYALIKTGKWEYELKNVNETFPYNDFYKKEIYNNNEIENDEYNLYLDLLMFSDYCYKEKTICLSHFESIMKILNDFIQNDSKKKLEEPIINQENKDDIKINTESIVNENNETKTNETIPNKPIVDNLITNDRQIVNDEPKKVLSLNELLIKIYKDIYECKDCGNIKCKNDGLSMVRNILSLKHLLKEKNESKLITEIKDFIKNSYSIIGSRKVEDDLYDFDQKYQTFSADKNNVESKMYYIIIQI